MAFLGGSFEALEPVGNSIVKTLGNTLQGLAQHKLNQKQSYELEKIGFPKQLASIFHTLDPKVQEGIWKQVNLSNIGQLQQQPQMQQAQPQQQMQSTFTPEQAEFIKTLSPLDRQRAAQQFALQNQQAQQAPVSSQPSQQFGQAAAQQQVAEQLAPKSIFQGNAGNSVAEQNLLEKQKSNAFKQQEALTAAEEKKQNLIDKKYQKTIEQYEKDYELGSKLEILANKMAELNEEIGDDWNPLKEGFTQGLYSKSGGFLDIRSVAGEKAEEFRRAASEYVDLSSNAVRGIPSKYRVQLKEASKPSLTQTYGARKSSVESAINGSKSLQIPYQETLQILEENNGNIPGDFSRKALPVIQKRQKEILKGENKISELEFDTLEEAQAAAKQYGARAIEDTSTKKKFKI